ncbi:globin [Cooperia oncophora]
MRLLILALAGFVAYATAMSPEDVKKNALAALEIVPLGTTPEKVQNGKDFYKYFFTNHQENRKYFKGAESFTADDVQKSDRFTKLGTGLLMSVHILANTYDNEMVFRAFVRDLMDRHKDRGVDPKLWKGFWGIYEAFLESKGKALSADQKAAIDAIGTRFNEEAQKQLAVLGLPHT